MKFSPGAWLVFAGYAALAVVRCSSHSSTLGAATNGGSISESAEPILDGGGAVAMPPDGAALCPAGVCNYQTQTGCGSAAPACVPLPNGDGGLSPACEMAGSVAIGGKCTQWTECQAGAICAAGKCTKLCCGKDWTGCPAGQHCLSPLLVEIAEGHDVESGAYLCVPVDNCDPLRPASGCTDPATSCQIADPTGAAACSTEGSGKAGDPCPCKGGYACVDNGCRRLCKAELGGVPACPPAEGRCVHFNRDPAGVGECTPQ